MLWWCIGISNRAVSFLNAMQYQCVTYGNETSYFLLVTSTLLVKVKVPTVLKILCCIESRASCRYFTVKAFRCRGGKGLWLRNDF